MVIEWMIFPVLGAVCYAVLKVSESVIRRRFHAGLRNFDHIYKDLVDEWAVYDNAGDQPVLVEEGRTI